jgi:hypothetical protein
MAQESPILESVMAPPSSIESTVIVEGFGVNGLDLIAVTTLKETLGEVFDEAWGNEVRSSILTSLHVTTEWTVHSHSQARLDINAIEATRTEAMSTLHLDIHALTNGVASTVRAVLSNLNTDAESFTASWAAKMEELGDVPPSGVLLLRLANFAH